MRDWGKWVREGRERLGMSQAELARAMAIDGHSAVSRQAVWNWERNVQRPSEEAVLRLDKVFRGDS